MVSQIRLKQGILILAPLVFSFFVFWKFLIIWQVPFRLDYAEGFVYFNSIRVLNGESIYQSIGMAPHVPGYYPPIIFGFLASLMTIFGEFIGIGRLVSFAAFLLVAVLISLIIFRFTKSKFLALFSGLIFVSSLIASQWAFVIRPDMLALLAVTVGIFYATGKELKSKRELLILALIFGFAFFIKQNLVFAPLAVAIWLFIKDRWRSFIFVTCYLFIILTGVVLLTIQTEGFFFSQAFLYAGNVDYTKWYPAFRVGVVTIVASLPFFLIAFYNSFKKPRELLSVYFLVSVVGFFMIIREGGTTNYLLEFVSALILRTVVSDVWFKLLARRVLLTYLLIIVFVGSLILMSFSVFPWELTEFKNEKMRFFNEEKVIVTKTSKEILSEDAFLPIAVDKKVHIEPFTFGQTVKSDIVSSTFFYKSLDSGWYEFVIDQGAFKTIPGFDNYLKSNFETVYIAKSRRPLKGFDYSLYNLHKFGSFGKVYKFIPKGVSD